jgi:hypothetical protein
MVPPDTVEDAVPTFSGADETLEEHAEQAAARTASHTATTGGPNLPAGRVKSENLSTSPLYHGLLCHGPRAIV